MEIKKFLIMTLIVASQFMFLILIGAHFNMSNLIIYNTTPSLKRNNTLKVSESGEAVIEDKTKDRFRPGKGMLFSEVFDNVAKVKTVQLLIICLTPPFRKERRLAIRKTWWKTCKTNAKIACLFFTDRLESITDDNIKAQILGEQKEHKDIVFSPVDKGILFGFRFLQLIQWGMANYDFDYLMRIDDDILFCIDHFLWDLPHFPKENLHWGFLQCQMRHIVYIDEGICMFSRDVIVKFLSQKADKILCHPYGDQQITIWEQAIGFDLNKLYHPDTRLHHHPPASHVAKFKTMENICDNYIYLHGIYGNDMVDFWNRRGDGKYSVYQDKRPKEMCPHEPIMDWHIFGGMYHQEPKPCINKPTWNTGHPHYPGREGR